MKRFIQKMTLLFCLIFITVVSLLFMVRPETDHYLYAIKDKHALLQSTPSPRLIFVGGSNLALGLDSQLIEEQTGYNVVNMGLEIYIGLQFMLNEISPHLKDGDIVVIAPEYMLFQHSYFYGAAPDFIRTLQILFPKGFRYLSFPQHYLAILKNSGGFLNQIGLRLTRKLAIFLKGTRFSSASRATIYSRSAFNLKGDFIGHLKVKSKRDLSKPLLSNPLFDERWFQFYPKSLSILNSYDRRVDEKGGCVFFSFPPLPTSYYHQKKQIIDDIYYRLKDGLEIPMLGTPLRYTFPDEDFFDTVYHLNAEGRRQRTIKVVEDLRRVLISTSSIRRTSQGRTISKGKKKEEK